jgi:alpha-galactosidase
VSKTGDQEVWVKPLSGGANAVLLLNRGQDTANFGFTWDQLGFADRQRAKVRDLWAHRYLGRRSKSFSATVEPHGVVMLKVQP